MQIEDSTTKIREDPRSNLWGPHSGVLNPAAPVMIYIYKRKVEEMVARAVPEISSLFVCVFFFVVAFSFLVVVLLCVSLCVCV